MWKAVINYVAFLGWTPPSHNTSTTLNTPPSAQNKNSRDINYSEVMSMDQLVEQVRTIERGNDLTQFSLSKVHRAPAVVSLDKLNWLNENHLRKAIREYPSEILPELRDNMERTFGSEVAKRYDDQYLKEVLLCLEVGTIFLLCADDGTVEEDQYVTRSDREARLFLRGASIIHHCGLDERQLERGNR